MFESPEIIGGLRVRRRPQSLPVGFMDCPTESAASIDHLGDRPNDPAGCLILRRVSPAGAASAIEISRPTRSTRSRILFLGRMTRFTHVSADRHLNCEYQRLDVYLQGWWCDYYGCRWITVASNTGDVFAGGGSGNRVTARRTCSSTARLVGWRGLVDVDLIGVSDPAGYTPSTIVNLYCVP
jgi:hypothetical protein